MASSGTPNLSHAPVKKKKTIFDRSSAKPLMWSCFKTAFSGKDGPPSFFVERAYPLNILGVCNKFVSQGDFLVVRKSGWKL